VKTKSATPLARGICDCQTRHRFATMKLSLFLAALSSTGALAAQCISRRPTLKPMPYSPRVPFPSPPRRSKVCVVKTHGDGVTDDSDSILSAFHECNNGGHVLFPRGETYTIGTAMDWTFLKHIDIGMTTPPRVPKREPCTTALRLGRNWAFETDYWCDRHPRPHPVHQRHDILAGELVPFHLPECDVLLQAWRGGRVDLRR
jgi:hypothetical protein